MTGYFRKTSIKLPSRCSHRPFSYLSCALCVKGTWNVVWRWRDQRFYGWLPCALFLAWRPVLSIHLSGSFGEACDESTRKLRTIGEQLYDAAASGLDVDNAFCFKAFSEASTCECHFCKGKDWPLASMVKYREGNHYRYGKSTRNSIYRTINKRCYMSMPWQSLPQVCLAFCVL